MTTIQDAASALGLGYEVAKKLCHAHGLGRYLGRSRILDDESLERLRTLAEKRGKRGRPRKPVEHINAGAL